MAQVSTSGPMDDNITANTIWTKSRAKANTHGPMAESMMGFGSKASNMAKACTSSPMELKNTVSGHKANFPYGSHQRPNQNLLTMINCFLFLFHWPTCSF